MKKDMLCKLATLLAGIGAFNWLLVGFIDLNLVHLIFGSFEIVEKIVYLLVGLSGLKLIMHLFIPPKG